MSVMKRGKCVVKPSFLTMYQMLVEVIILIVCDCAPRRLTIRPTSPGFLAFAPPCRGFCPRTPLRCLCHTSNLRLIILEVMYQTLKFHQRQNCRQSQAQIVIFGAANDFPKDGISTAHVSSADLLGLEEEAPKGDITPPVSPSFLSQFFYYLRCSHIG